MSGPRDKVVKTRFSEDEFDRLNALWKAAGARSCAAFIRGRALETELGSAAIAELVGRVGLTLNMLETKPQDLHQLNAELADLVSELRKRRAD